MGNKKNGAVIIAPEDDKRPREANKTNDSVFDRIYKSYFGKSRIELKAEEIRIRDRWDYAYRLLCNANTNRVVVEALMKKFDIQKSKAYDDISNVILLFGSQGNTNKEFKRLRAEGWIIRGIQKAWKAEDLENYHRLINRYTKINGLDVSEDSAIADLIRKLKPTILMFTTNAEQLKKEADDLMHDVPTMDVEHKEVA